ncbi:hypothetical protein INR49_030149 [Caranx melampygus]|nr:hypothetical protein INR49_030149 [Caranx melampygus]
MFIILNVCLFSPGPEAVSIITVTGNTTAMAVKWTQAFGGVLSYDVLLYKRDQLLPTKMDLPNTTQDVVFVDLEPGVLYCAVVSTKSGSFQTDSPKVCNATFPTPPGPIAVEFQTEESINFIWPVPDLMNHTNYSFSVSSIHGTSLTANNSFLLGHLESGSLYNISVVTVGVSGYQSTPVTAQNYTRPLAVINLTETEITTNAVTLEWKQLNSKPHYTYEVKFTNGSYSYHRVVNMTTDTVDGLSSGSHYSFTVTTQTADGTQASPVTVSYFTRPYAITSLEAETLDMTTVNLTWMQPLEYKKEYAYQVETTGCGSQKESVVNEIAQISRLIPGTNCTFCVSVRAENGIEGEAVCISQYTKPEAVQPSISSQGSNSSVLVSWSKPHGNVEHYKVYLNRTSSPDSWQELNSTTTSLLFYDLSAGMLYTTIVVTYSGPFNATSGPITNATFPNPPGSIENLTKTTSSITIRWNEAPLMTGASFFYKLISTQSQGSGDITTNNTTTTNYTFATLLPGTSYNISITTVGPRGFESEVVHRYLVTTKPLSVETLVRKTEENNMTVTWERSADYKEGYRYIVEWRGQNGLNVGTTDKTEYTINNLEPGTNYSFEVTTETSDSTRSAPSSNFNCTKASPVKDLTCTSPNEPNAQISLSWTTPSGLHSGFLVRVNDSEIHSTNTCCNYTVSNLKHFTYYSLYVETLSCGLPSIPVSQSCHTGITVPPIPLDYESLLVVTERVYNKFSLQIERRMLDGTNGPVTHVGVLVTENPPGNNLSSFLGKTYHQWRAKETEVYLATIEEVSFQSRSGEGVITIIVGDETTWKGYTNGPLDATEKYQYAIVFFTHLETVEGLVDVNESLFSITSPSFTIELPQDPAVIGLAVGVTLGIFCILFIILIGFIIYWRRLSNKESSDIQIHSMRAEVSL